ncbi:MAG: tRNA-dihydrouridine synthase [Halodesulfurarchaeum sp.]
MFEPRIALASLSGESDAAWAKAGSRWVGGAFLGGLALDEATRNAAKRMVAERDREEFLPPDPFDFMDAQLDALETTDLTPGFNVRSIDHESLRRAAAICAERDAFVEINAHCRQPEMTSLGAGQAMLTEPERLEEQVATAAETGATVSVKVRAEIDGVDLPAVCERAEVAGADILHVDAMDSESEIAAIDRHTDAFLIANNEVRDEESVVEYLEYGADAVSVARASTNPAVLRRVNRAVLDWFGESSPEA